MLLVWSVGDAPGQRLKAGSISLEDQTPIHVYIGSFVIRNELIWRERKRNLTEDRALAARTEDRALLSGRLASHIPPWPKCTSHRPRRCWTNAIAGAG